MSLELRSFLKPWLSEGTQGQLRCLRNVSVLNKAEALKAIELLRLEETPQAVPGEQVCVQVVVQQGFLRKAQSQGGALRAARSLQPFVFVTCYVFNAQRFFPPLHALPYALPKVFFCVLQPFALQKVLML